MFFIFLLLFPLENLPNLKDREVILSIHDLEIFCFPRLHAPVHAQAKGFEVRSAVGESPRGPQRVSGGVGDVGHGQHGDVVAGKAPESARVACVTAERTRVT